MLHLPTELLPEAPFNSFCSLSSFRGFYRPEISYIPSTIPSTTQSFSRSLLLTKTPLPPQGRSFPLQARHSERGSYNNRPHYHRLPLQQQDFLKSRSPLLCQVINVLNVATSLTPAQTVTEGNSNPSQQSRR